MNSDFNRTFKRKLKQLKQNPKSVIVSIAFMILFIGTYIFSSDFGVLGNVIILTILVVSAPYFILSYMKFAKIKEIEKKFPQFLRDVADSVNSGSSLPQAFRSTTKSDYGKLSSEIKRMTNQLSWGVSFEKTIRTFTKRMEKSDVIVRSMTILLEAYKAGGNISPILNSVADSVDTLKETDDKKKSLLKEHVVMMYAIFFIFIGIVMALTGILLPILNLDASGSSQSSFSGIGKGGNPCDVCIGFQCTLCDTFEGIGTSAGFGEGIEAYYKAVFFVMIMLQGLFTGLVAGQIGDDSLKAGMKHSMIMMGSGFAIYMIIIRLGLI